MIRPRFLLDMLGEDDNGYPSSGWGQSALQRQSQGSSFPSFGSSPQAPGTEGDLEPDLINGGLLEAFAPKSEWKRRATGIPDSDPTGQQRALGMAMIQAAASMANANRPGARFGNILAHGGAGFAGGLGFQSMMRDKQAVAEAAQRMQEMRARREEEQSMRDAEKHGMQMQLMERDLKKPLGGGGGAKGNFSLHESVDEFGNKVVGIFNKDTGAFRRLTQDEMQGLVPGAMQGSIPGDGAGNGMPGAGAYGGGYGQSPYAGLGAGQPGPEPSLMGGGGTEYAGGMGQPESQASLIAPEYYGYNNRSQQQQQNLTPEYLPYAIAGAQGQQREFPQLRYGPGDSFDLAGNPVKLGKNIEYSTNKPIDMQLPNGEKASVLLTKNGNFYTVIGAHSGAEREKALEEETKKYADIVLEDAGRAKNKAKDYSIIPNTGMGGKLFSYIPGTSAHDLSSTLQTIKAGIGFDKLQAMRENSPTGGALGQVSNEENKLLQAALGSLEQSQSEKEFMYNMNRIEKIYMDIVHGKGNWSIDNNGNYLVSPGIGSGAQTNSNRKRRKFNPTTGGFD